MENVTPGARNLITDIAGIKIGNAEDHAALTGVTALLCDWPMMAAADIRGGAPGTRDTDALDPACLVEGVHALVLSGGSVFGLEAAGGVTAWLSQRNIGMTFAAQATPIPVVPSAILFDLANGGDKSWGLMPPYRDLGIAAAEAAGEAFALGNNGAGLGATAGQLKGGLGSVSVIWEDFTIGALVAVNPVGSAVDPRNGDLWARGFELAGEFGDAPRQPPVAGPLPVLQGTKLSASLEASSNTTIAIVASNARLDKAETERFAIMATDGMARAIRPIHTTFDGDSVFALANGQVELPAQRAACLSALGTLAADCLTRAIGRAMAEAAAIPGWPAWRE